MNRRSQLFIKVLFDRILSIILIIILMPLWLIIVIAIRLEDGNSILFCQDRVGKKGRIFRIKKFRTMIINADQYLDNQGRILNKNRVTRVGKILRYLSLDELPQLINIATSEMSLIGPRPMLPSLFERLTPEQQSRRMQIKPGLTGWAQINGRNTMKWSKRIEYDIWYVEHYSLWLDLKIFVKTIKVVLLREGIVLDRNSEDVDDLPHPPTDLDI